MEPERHESEEEVGREERKASVADKTATEQSLAKQNTAKQSRRRLLGAGAAIAPFVLTVASRPALGVECTGSALMSGNHSTSMRRDPNVCYYQELGRSPMPITPSVRL